MTTPFLTVNNLIILTEWFNFIVDLKSEILADRLVKTVGKFQNRDSLQFIQYDNKDTLHHLSIPGYTSGQGQGSKIGKRCNVIHYQ